MKKSLIKAIAIFTAVVMVALLLPMSAFAESEIVEVYNEEALREALAAGKSQIAVMSPISVNCDVKESKALRS